MSLLSKYVKDVEWCYLLSQHLIFGAQFEILFFYTIHTLRQIYRYQKK